MFSVVPYIIQRLVQCDPVEPGRHFRIGTEFPDRPKYFNEHFLGNIICIPGIMQYTHTGTEYHLPVLLYQFPEGIFIALKQSVYSVCIQCSLKNNIFDTETGKYLCFLFFYEQKRKFFR